MTHPNKEEAPADTNAGGVKAVLIDGAGEWVSAHTAAVRALGGLLERHGQHGTHLAVPSGAALDIAGDADRLDDKRLCVIAVVVVLGRGATVNAREGRGFLYLPTLNGIRNLGDRPQRFGVVNEPAVAAEQCLSAIRVAVLDATATNAGDFAGHLCGLLAGTRGEVFEVNLTVCEFHYPAIPAGRDANRSGHCLRNGRSRLAQELGQCLLSSGYSVTPCFEVHAASLVCTQLAVKRVRNLFLLPCPNG